MNSVSPKQGLHISSGGVVYTYNEQRQPLVLLLHRYEENSWHLPKGTPEPGETLTETALREIEEETGSIVTIECYLGSEFSTFERGNSTILKQTHYYLMRFQSGELQILDDEHDEVTWQPISQALKLLGQTGSNCESRIVTSAQKVLNRPLKSRGL